MAASISTRCDVGDIELRTVVQVLLFNECVSTTPATAV